MTALKTFLLAAAAAPLALAGDFVCGNHRPSETNFKTMERLRARELTSRGFGQPLYKRWNDTLNIPTYIHAVVSKNDSDNYMTEADAFRQIEVMNKAFGPSNIHFTLSGTSRVVSDELTSMDVDNEDTDIAHQRYWAATRKGDYGALNLWFYNELVSGEDGLYGYCSFPEEDYKTFAKTKGLFRDGCHIKAGTRPGGESKDMNLGYTAVHETGHWFGLFHVFSDEGTCNGRGDLIDDTPPQSKKSTGCMLGKDSCPSMPGYDSIHNYMDYSDDACYEGFTAGQYSRMHNSYWSYRYGKGRQSGNATTSA